MGTPRATAVRAMPSPASLDWKAWLNELIAFRRAEIPTGRTITWFFSQAGDDTVGDGTEGNPWKTLAKATTMLASLPTNANVRLRFRRGDTWRENTGLVFSKNQVTIDSFGTDPKRPVFSRFATPYTTGWTLTAAQTITYERAETNTVAWVRNVGEVATCLTRRASIAEVEANPGSWWWDSGSNKLYVSHPSAAGNWMTALTPASARWSLEAVYDNDTAGIDATGDNIRIQNIVLEGWGCGNVNRNNTGYGIVYRGSTANNCCIVENCDSYFNQSHNIGLNQPANGGAIFTVINCRVGWMSGCVTTSSPIAGTNFVAYSGPGGHEAIFSGCEVIAGELQAAAVPYATRHQSTAFYGHAATQTTGFYVADKCWVEPSDTQCQVLAHFDCNSTTFLASQAFVVDCRYEARRNNPADIASGAVFVLGWLPRKNNVWINCIHQAAVIGGRGSGQQNAARELSASAIFGGVLINCDITVDYTDQTPHNTWQRSLWYGANTEDYRAYNCALRIKVAGECLAQMQRLTGNSLGKIFNSILTCEGGNSRTEFQPCLNNDPAFLLNNAYVTRAARTNKASATLGYSNDTYAVEIFNNWGYGNERNDSLLLSANQQLVEGEVLEYDAFWQPRGTTSTARGPYEVLTSSGNIGGDVPLCDVEFVVTNNGTPMENARVIAQVIGDNSTTDGLIVANRATEALTDVNGECTLTLIRQSAFTRGGAYQIRIEDENGVLVHSRKVVVPDAAVVNAEDLEDAP